MEPVLPEPDITIMIPENTVNPFDHMTEAIIEWLKNHDDAEDVLVGENANPEGIEGYEELKLLGPHPYLERQMTLKAPRRWLHLKLQMVVNNDHWLRLILRADNLYVKGMANRPGNLGLKCFEITEPEVDGVPGKRAALLFPEEYKATPLDWDVKYHQILSCQNDMRRENNTVALDLSPLHLLLSPFWRPRRCGCGCGQDCAVQGSSRVLAPAPAADPFFLW